MSKKYRNKTCVYCTTRPSELGDHVFAREFFLESERGNLPQVPACSSCNGEKSVLEHYLATVLPFGGQHRDALRLLSERVPRRLAKNQKLHRELAAGMREEWAEGANGLIAKRMALPFDSTRIEGLFAFIVKGLIYRHWSILLPQGYGADAALMREAGQPHWERLRAHPNAGHHVSDDLGSGSFQYEGFRDIERPYISGWQFRVYGRVPLGGDAAMPDEVATMLIGRSIALEKMDSVASAKLGVG